MKFKSLVTATALATLINPVVIMAQDAGLTDIQKQEVQKIVHDYLVANPEVLVEAAQSLQAKQQQTMQKQAQAAIGENAESLFKDKLTTTGNAQGNVTIVEFFDYQCIHCKKMAPVLSELLTSDKNLRVIYKEFPIFGKSSVTASRAALAAGMQNNYLGMHEALLKLEGRLNDEIIMNTAKSIGLDMVKLKKDMDSKEVTEALDNTRILGEKLRLMGTPAFIIASTPAGQFKKGSNPAFIPGATTKESLQELIKKAAQ